jgi:hypothetical protein
MSRSCWVCCAQIAVCVVESLAIRRGRASTFFLHRRMESAVFTAAAPTRPHRTSASLHDSRRIVGPDRWMRARPRPAQRHRQRKRLEHAERWRWRKTVLQPTVDALCRAASKTLIVILQYMPTAGVSRAYEAPETSAETAAEVGDRLLAAARAPTATLNAATEGHVSKGKRLRYGRCRIASGSRRHTVPATTIYPCASGIRLPLVALEAVPIAVTRQIDVMATYSSSARYGCGLVASAAEAAPESHPASRAPPLRDRKEWPAAAMIKGRRASEAIAERHLHTPVTEKIRTRSCCGRTQVPGDSQTPAAGCLQA